MPPVTDLSVRPRLRRDTYLMSTVTGARIVTNRGSDTFDGATIHDWIDRLAPHLDGRATLDALTARLPAARRDMVERVVGALAQRGLVRDANLGEAPPVDDGELGYLDSFVPSAHAALRRFRAARIVVDGSGPIADEVTAALVEAGADPVDTAADLVVCVGGRDTADRVLSVARTCRASGVPLVVGLLDGDGLWIASGGCWESIWLRLLVWDDGPPVAAATVPPDAAAVAGGALGMAAFRLLTAAAAPGEISRLELSTMDCTTHRVLPRTVGPVGQDTADTVTATVERLRAGPPSAADELDRAGAALLDPRLGVLGEVSDRAFTQLPLAVAAVTVAGPPRLVTAAAPEVTPARWRAVLAGVAAHCASAADPARLTDGRVWGVRLADGTARQVDASAVFGTSGVGLAAADDWTSAVSAALLDQCARLTAGAGDATARQLELSALEIDDEAGYCLEMLDVLGVEPVVYDVTGRLGVPTLAFAAGGTTVAWVSGWRAADTLAGGLRAVLLAEQSRRSGQPEYAPPPVPQPAPFGGRGTAPAECAEAGAVAAMLALGSDPVVVPLDHDRAVHAIAPYVVRVVLADA